MKDDFNMSEKEFQSGIKKRFYQYRDMVEKLTSIFQRYTDHDIIKAVITNDSKRIVLLFKDTDEQYSIKLYNTESYSASYSI